MDEDTFKLIYSQFFPQGGESEARSPPPSPSSPSSAEGGHPFYGAGLGEGMGGHTTTTTTFTSTSTLPATPCLRGLVLPLSCWKGGLQPGTQLEPSAGLSGMGSGLELPGSPKTPQPSSSLLPDATTYAHFLFNAFDADGNGAIRFEVGPC